MAVVIELGSGWIKAGESGEDIPTSYFPAVVGYPKNANIDAVALTDMYVGEQALARGSLLRLVWPMERRMVVDWVGFKKIIQSIFDGLGLSSEGQSVLLVVSADNLLANREQMTSVLLGDFSVASVYFVVDAEAALYSAGAVTGVVLHIGEYICQAMPVQDGVAVPEVAANMLVAGRVLTEYLQWLLMSSGTGISSKNNGSYGVLGDIKAKACYVALDLKVELDNVEVDQLCELPDGQQITLGRERFVCPEKLFNSTQPTDGGESIAQILLHSIAKVGTRGVPELWIVLSGGSTLFEGLPERLQAELDRASPEGTKLKVIASPERKFNAWIGASILASLDSFDTWKR